MAKGTIYLRLSNGNGQRVRVSLTNPLSVLISPCKALMKNSEFEVMFRGKVLELTSCTSLSEAGIIQESILHVVDKVKIKTQHFTLRVIANANRYKLQVEQSNSILYLKIYLSKELKVDIEHILICHLGVELIDNKTFGDCGIGEDALLSVAIIGSFQSQKQFNQQLGNSNQQILDEEIKNKIEETQKKECQALLDEKGLNNLFHNEANFETNNIKETYSIAGLDERTDKCKVELIRKDKMREYTLQCNTSYKFIDIKKAVARLECTTQTRIKLMQFQDEHSMKDVIDSAQLIPFVEKPLNTVLFQNNDKSLDKIQQDKSQLKSQDKLDQKQQEEKKNKLFEMTQFNSCDKFQQSDTPLKTQIRILKSEMFFEDSILQQKNKLVLMYQILA